MAEELDAAETSPEVVVSGSQGVQIGSGNIQTNIFSPEGLALGAAVAIYSKAFLETLGTRTGDRVADLLQTRFRLGKGKGGVEAQISLKADAAATVIVTEGLPDEARLALIDLDITTDDVRGKTLRWDNDAMAWHPESTEENAG